MKVPRTHRLCDRGSSTRAIQKVLLAALVGFAAPRLFAHPVSQGSLEVEILQDAVRLRARVSTEEAFVASAFGGAATSGGETGSDPQASLWAAHGRYLLDHLRVFEELPEAFAFDATHRLPAE